VSRQAVEQVKPGIAKGRDCVEQSVERSPGIPQGRAPVEPEQDRAGQFNGQRREHDPGGNLQDSSRFQQAERIAQCQAIREGDLPSQQAQHDHRGGHEPDAAHLDQHHQHDLAEQRQVAGGDDGRETGHSQG